MIVFIVVSLGAAKYTLFPYTTLFRSVAVRDGEVLLRLRVVGRRLCNRHVLADCTVVDLQPEEDRKSTRLNSSHRCISYAVFCLKKKKKYTVTDAILAIPSKSHHGPST